jgi:hypothetical protein
LSLAKAMPALKRHCQARIARPRSRRGPSGIGVRFSQVLKFAFFRILQQQPKETGGPED